MAQFIFNEATVKITSTMRELNSVTAIGDGNDVTFNHPDGFSITIYGGTYKVGSQLVATTQGIHYLSPGGVDNFVTWGGIVPKYSEKKEITRETIEI
jgi:hypothetical protein